MNEQQKQRLAEMPSVNPHRPYDDDKPDGYLASFRDWAEDNEPAVRWFLENHAQIRECLTLLDQAQRDTERLETLFKITNEEGRNGRWAVALEYDNYQDVAVIRNADGSILAECGDLIPGVNEIDLPDAQFREALDQAALARGEGEK